MSEDAELKLKIAQLSGRINRKEQEDTNTVGPASFVKPAPPHASSYHANASSWRPYRGAPYARGRGRGKPTSVAHKNRTLVLNNAVNNGSAQDDGGSTSRPLRQGNDSTTGQSGPATGWIAKHDRHKQLINAAVYERQVMTRAKDMEETRKAKARSRDEREKRRLNRHLQRLYQQQASTDKSSNGKTGTSPVYEIMIQGIRFRVTNGGSRLLKIPDELHSTRPTPKRANVGGVTFVRSKTGNLYRSGIVKAKRSETVKKILEPCKRFTSTGTFFSEHYSLAAAAVSDHLLGRRPDGSCPKGPSCPYIHDHNKVAICKAFLQNGECPAGESCDLSHSPTPERVPACLHFLRGNCSNANCRYAHVRVNPGAPVCRKFATLGFCEDGAKCPQRHIHECPDYANSGVCNNKKCRLPHVDRAGQIRKSAANPASGQTDEQGEDESDISSDDDDHESDSDDVDSDGLTEDLADAVATASERGLSREVSAQRDFIHF